MNRRNNAAANSWLLFIAPPRRRGWLAAVDWGLYGLGSLLCFSFLYSVAEELGPALAGAGLVALALLALRARTKALRWTLRGLLLLVHLFFLYVLVSFSFLLGWSTSLAERLGVAGMAVLSLLSIFLHWRSLRAGATPLQEILETASLDPVPNVSRSNAEESKAGGVKAEGGDEERSETGKIETGEIETGEIETGEIETKACDASSRNIVVGSSASANSMRSKPAASGLNVQRAYPSIPSRRRILLSLPIFPPHLVMGAWSTLCLLGWHAQDGTVRCDDYLQVLEQPEVSMLVYSTQELKSCQKGQSFLLHRYPRRVWEEPGGGRFIVSTQKGIRVSSDSLSLVPDSLDGSICEAYPGEAPHRCVGKGKAQPIFEVEGKDHLFVLSWGHREGGKGRIHTISRQAPLELLSETATPESFGEGFYDRKTDMFYLLSDECKVALPVRGSDRAFLEPIPAAICPGETHYNQKTQEGIFCGGVGALFRIEGQAYSGVAFRGEPFSYRLLAPSRKYPRSWLNMTWGCDLNEKERIAYVVSATLGLVQVIDYDTGDLLRDFSIPIGVRNLRYDPGRDWLFVAEFLQGRVIAMDAKTGEHRGSWLAGRFVRGVEPARNGKDILVTSSLGVLKISPSEADGGDDTVEAVGIVSGDAED